MSTGRPLIGLTTSEVRRPVRDEQLPHAEAGREEMVLNLHYMRAVTRAGGMPVVMSPQPDEVVPELLARFDGIVIPGGPDIHPSMYGAEPHPKLGPTWPEVDRFEAAVVREAERRGLPLLAICRGMQLLNVVHGGTLHQHLPDHPGDDIAHRREADGDPDAMHTVHVERESRLCDLLGREGVYVNSFHHQAPDEVGDGLRPVAHALDGVVEGIEGDGFLVGVQWHAEAMQDAEEQQRLFSALIEAARR
jgi:putative glutamine amidotransferase